MKVSVIMPAFNAATTIAEAIRSVLSQTHRDWELVIVDDGSIDATPAIATQFIHEDSRIRMVRQPNRGESGARNTGVEEARFDWLLFLDSDDWIAPSYLERMTAELASSPGTDAVHCGSVRVAADGTEVHDDYFPSSGDLFPTLALRAAFPVHACIVRKSLVESVGKFDTALRKSPDWDLWQRIARTGARFQGVRETLAFYRMAPRSASLEAEQLLRDGLTVLRRGCGPDPRVPNPHPDHADGMGKEHAQRQQYYLLSWCAGLLIGSGQDATHLLKLIAADRSEELFPDALARCVFEAATLPHCRARSAWEELWPSIHSAAETFFTALADVNRTPPLASQSIAELKKLVLKHSPTWGSAMADLEARFASLERLLNEQREQERRKASQREARLKEEVWNWQAVAEQRELFIANMKDQFWVRLGSATGLFREPDVRVAMTPAADVPDEEYSTTGKWELSVCGGSRADLVRSPDEGDAVRVEISRAAARTDWHVQLNVPKLGVTAGQRYAVEMRARADQRRDIALGVAMAHDPWTGLGLYKKITLQQQWQTFREEFTCIESDDNARIHFDLGSSAVSVDFGGVMLRSESDGEPAQVAAGTERPKDVKAGS